LKKPESKPEEKKKSKTVKATEPKPAQTSASRDEIMRLMMGGKPAVVTETKAAPKEEE